MGGRLDAAIEASPERDKEMMEMFRARAVLLGLTAVIAAFAVSAPSASARIKFLWKAGGVELKKSTEDREILTVEADGKTFDFNGTVAGARVLLLSKEVSVESGAKIIGGVPGSGEETLLFRATTVDEPVGCSVESEGAGSAGVIRTNPLKVEIVEGQEDEEPLILLTPKTGTVITSLLFLDKSKETCLTGAPVLANLTGSLLAQPLPSLTETVDGDLDFEAPTKNFFLSGGTLDKAGLLFGGAAFEVTGLTLSILTTDETYGAF